MNAALAGGAPDWDTLFDGYRAAVDWTHLSYARGPGTRSAISLDQPEKRVDLRAWLRTT